MDTAVPFLSSLVSFIFALLVLDQYLAKRKPHQLLWSIGLLLYAIATASEFWVGTFGLASLPYRLWYLCGAIFTAAYLGIGTLYLLLPRRPAHIIMALLGALSLYALVRVVLAEVNLDLALSEAGVMVGKGLPQGVRLITPFFNTFGTVALVGGALYSAWFYWRRRQFFYRVVSNSLIALGAILPAAGGSLSRLGFPEGLYLLELLGIIIIFLGFLRSREVFGIYRLPFSQGFRKVD